MDMRISQVNKLNQIEAPKIQNRDIAREFEFTLKRLGQEGLAERLEGLINDITVMGKKIAEHMDIRDMKQYRGLIGDFINEVVTNSHEFSRENFLDRRGRHRVYGIVRVVNQELDDLAQELLKSEKDHIKILDKTDQIRGLLLDIVI